MHIYIYILNKGFLHSSPIYPYYKREQSNRRAYINSKLLYITLYQTDKNQSTSCKRKLYNTGIFKA